MMQSTSEGSMNIAELANQLRREKIYINAERQLLQTLNEDVERSTLELLQAAWICSMQRQNLLSLLAARCEADCVVACQKISLLDGTKFIDAHKVLKYKEVQALGDLLGWLRDSPHLTALCLLLGEDHITPGLLPALVAGLYGSCRSPADRTRLLAVIRSLIKHHMAPFSDPRKLVQQGKCALFSLYTVFRDGHTPAQHFLIAVLQGPIMSVLQEDDFFLDADPDKILERFSVHERLKKFGQPNSQEYHMKVARYRKWVVQSLYNMTSAFIQSLREYWTNFPASIAWIVQQVAHLLKQHSNTSDAELHALCTDLVLTNFICPAIINPDSHGVVEVPISYVARFNLMQIAQIIQMLSHAKFIEVEPKARDLYSKFDRGCVWSLIESVCEGSAAPAPPAPLDAHPRTDSPRQTTLALYTAQELSQLITFLKHVSSKLNNNTTNNNEDVPNGIVPGASAIVSSEPNVDCSDNESATCAATLAALVQTLEPNYRSRLLDLLKKTPDLTHYKQSPTESKEQHIENGHIRSILAKVPKSKLARSGSSGASLGEDKTNGVEEGLEHPEVLIIKLANVEDNDYIGLEPESKVLECYYGGSEAGDADDAVGALTAAGPGATVQKRTRFSVSHDEVSLGNTSDNLEAVSEAASNHSVTSSLELETEDQNDNLSDMVSANVSGRGSPNISGRETPSSQVTDGDAAGDAPPRRIPPNAPANQPNSAQAKLLKQTRNDIEDKFCKFEIKKLLEGDETVSIMSDTWSTDVLASDSETIGDTCDHTQVANTQAGTGGTAPDASETASESAWSIDVIASDSDRNTEVDTDDCVSVAARSDTSWPRRPSNQEESTPIKLPNGSLRRPDINSPKHTVRPFVPNWTVGYLSATAALSRGGELDLTAQSPRLHHIENRKSILVNGYPVMCYATSAPESPSASTPAPLPNNEHGFEFVTQNGNSVQTESTLEGNSQSDATSQWVDDSFPQPHHSPDRPFPSTSKYDLPSTSKNYEDPDMDRSLNSSESSFNALSVSQYDRRFDSGIDTERQETEPRSTITDLVTRMSSATISTSANIVNRIVKSEIRTSIVSISSTRIEKKRDANSNMSLSTLSVNSGETSVSDRSSSQDVNSENVTERRISPPPVKTASTGAIPKSISFDASAEKSQRRRIPLINDESLVGNLDELKNNVKRSGGNLLHRIKMFRQKGRSHQQHNDTKTSEDECRGELVRVEAARESRDGESSEEILAKYRGKSTAEPRPRRPSRRASDLPDIDDRSEGLVDLNDPEVFDSMKRKLRLVLSNQELHCADYVPNRCSSSSLVEWVTGAAACSRSEGGAALGAALARALQHCPAAAPRLAAALRADLAARRPYAAYLARCRVGLAASLAELRRQVSVIRGEGCACARVAAATRTLDQLEKSSALRRVAKYHHPNNNYTVVNGGELMDEKASRLTASIKAITAEVKADPSWEGASSTMLETAEITVERAAFGRLYLQVLFPNGDGDIARDQVLSEHIRRLRLCTSAARAGVSARHMWAVPFPSAQALLTHLPVYRTPRDKVACVVRCMTSIMSVLSLSDGATPAADDLTPVLVYVIIKVNPSCLLSTIELVNALGGASGVLQGEAHYWWTLFCAAVAYIKTMDYPRQDAHDT